jgi:beta-barrel assembly-enhancing protease
MYVRNPLRELILSLIVLAGCSTPVTPPVHVDTESTDQETRLQRALRFRMAYNQQQRVVHVAFPMLTAAAPLCEGAVHYVTGMSFSNRRSFELGSEAIAVLGLTDEVKVTGVVPGSPADLAGVRVDDLVVAVDGSPAPKGAGATEAVQGKLEQLLKDGQSFSITLARDGVLRDAAVVPAHACRFSVVAIDGDVVNAFADGTTVTITVGMLRFVQDDTELALVISHELAHNLMKHVAAKSTNQLAGYVRWLFIPWFLGPAVAPAPGGQPALLSASAMPELNRGSYSKEFEAEADYVGLYMMARAGLPIDGAPQFWRRMGAAYPVSNQAAFGASHPSDADRMLAMEATVREIKRKIAAGSPLMPERRKLSWYNRYTSSHAESTDKARSTGTPYRITFLVNHNSGTSVLLGKTVDISSDLLELEDRVGRCLSEAMRSIDSSLNVTEGREFRRVAFPDLTPREAPHTADSVLALLKSPEFRRRIAPLQLRYIAVVGVSTTEKIGSEFMPSSSVESRFSVSVIDVEAGEVSHRENGDEAVSSGPGLPFRLLPKHIEPRVCAFLGERLARQLGHVTAFPRSAANAAGR